MPPSASFIAPRRLLALLLIAVLLGAAASASPASASGASASAADERTGRLLVMVDPGAQSRLASQIERTGVGDAGEQVPQIGLVTVKPVAGQPLAATAEALRALPGVKSVSVEHRHQFRFVPNDPALSMAETAPGTAPGITMDWWAARENLYAAWDTTRGSGAKVAVIDSGYDGKHPEFVRKIAATRHNEYPELDTGPANIDRDGHGTHVASLACGAGDNGVGIVGAGLNCKLIIIKSDLTDSSIARSLVQATDLGADAISMSFGSPKNAPPPAKVLRAGLNYARRHNVVLVAAAADDPVEQQGDPANLLQPTGTGPRLRSNRGLTVTSADYDGARTSFAGRGTQISLAGYGNFSSGSDGPPGILGAFPSSITDIDLGPPECECRRALDSNPRSTYAYLSGTSMAAPQVAGIAALVSRFNPDLSAAQVIRILKKTATRAPGTGWNPELGWGIVNAGDAVALARVTDRTRPTSQAKGPHGVRSSSRLTLRWTGRERRRRGLVASGVAKYEVWRSMNDGRYKRVATTRRTKHKRLTLVHGNRYRFYTIAVDKSANRERRPKRPDVAFRVSG